MARSLFCLLLLLPACSKAAEPQFPASACNDRMFEGSRIEVCSEPGGAIRIMGGAGDQPYRGFDAVQAALGASAGRIAFAINAGMFDDNGRAIGLLIRDGRQLHPINLRHGGGNFHLLPNGVFLVRRDGRAEVVTSTAYRASSEIRFATQSGPMLVIDGKLHPRFDADGESRNIRNGAGIAPDGTAVFAISKDPVSFGKFARFFRDSVHARNALYFDGAVSSLWDPANGRMDNHSQMGPMVVVFKTSG